ncbi:MAG: leucine-rich repeat domain-containing protein [Treponema sp.]|nr:leucine-rich repeat domain-containing protein [Treponema sp.]
MKNKNLCFGIALIVSIAIIFLTGCNSPMDPPQSDPELTNLAEVTAYLNSLPANTATNPHRLRISIGLGTMANTRSISDWLGLLTIIEEAGKFVNLDLSASTISGTAFNADTNINTGKAYIVSITLPNAATSVTGFGVHWIDWYSFDYIDSYFTNLTAVSGTGITAIGESAFWGCTSLTSVSFPVVTSIGWEAFTLCTSLTNVSFPMATTIGWGAFYDCTSLTNVSFPIATTIGSGAFAGCTSLTSIALPAAITISPNAFAGCTSLTNVSFPVVTTIDDAAFSHTGTTTLTITLGLEAPAVGVGIFAFVDGAKNVTVRVPAGSVNDLIGYTGFPPVNITDHTWANAFRGMGNISPYLAEVNANINLTLQTD